MKLFRKIKGKLGFTLAEMLIVVAILAILTAVAAPNVAKYSRGINLRELNDSARAIYMAAEHKFMNEIEMGRTLPEGAAVKENALEKRYGSEASAVNVKYLKSESTDLQKLMTSGSAAGDSTGVIESHLYDNNYIVEYNPETGDVFGVFYSEDDNLSGYEANCYPDIAEMQKEKLIGYYGSDNVKPEEKTNSKVLPKPEVEIINKEKLVVKITAPEVSGGEPISIKVKVNDTWIVPETGYNIVPGTTVDLILDSLISSGKPAIATTLVKSYEASIDTWLGSAVTDGSDMTLTVTFYDKDGKTRDQSVTKTFNPLFANGSTADTAYIEYGRHLQNLDKCSAINTAVIKKTINFASKAENYEGWANPDVYPGRKFNSIGYKDNFQIYGLTGTEIQNMQADYGGLFHMIGVNATISDLTFRNCSAEKDYLGYAGLLTALISNPDGSEIKFSNITAINPQVTGDFVGGLVGSADNITIENCKVYVETNSGETWDNPESDPYHNYAVKGTSCAGGLIGQAQTVNIINSYASINVISDLSSGTAGGLVGETSNTSTVIENSFAGGHTYYGIFKGTSKDSKTVSLEDNVSGMTAGGIAGKIDGGGLILKGTVFSTCSVTGTAKADPAYNYKIDTPVTIDPAATVYTLGTAYKTDGATVTEIKKSADTHVKTGDEVKLDDSSATVGMRYDLKVSSVYKYPVPTGMTMHGDWPSSDAVTGFFYWEKEPNSATKYHFHALWYGKGKPDILIDDLCKEQDGHNITDYGYGAFSVGGSLDSAVTFSDGTSTDVTNADVESAVQTALAAVDDLKITDSSTVAVKLYNVTDVSSSGFVTANIGGNEYVFAPEFYAISADKGSDHAGTDADVFGVRCKNHLQNVANALSGNFVQSHDINYKDDTTGLTPIGNSTNKFTGTYDGGSYRIINAKFNSTADSDYAGLFGVTENATLENIVLFNEAATADEFAEIKGKTVGGLVAKSTDGTISNCVVSGYTITGDTASGGIVGDSTGTKIETCEANVKFENVTNAVGGIAGKASGDVTDCYALVHDYLGSMAQVGGIVGGGASGKVDNCYSMFKGMFTTGKPIADHTVGNNIYVVDSGFCPKTSKIPNANDKPVEIEDLGLELKGSENAVKTYVSDAVHYAGKKEYGAYSYLAVVTDKDGDFVHYGPTPIPGSKGQLVTGPIAGVFNLKEYNYNGNNHSGQFDGLLSYDKHNQVFYAEKLIDGAVQYNGKDLHYIGVFLESSQDMYDDSIKIIVNGKTVEKKNIVSFDKAFQSEYGINVATPFIRQSGDYNFKNDEGNFDAYTHNGETYNTNLLSRFNFYLILEDGKIRWFEDTDEIEIWYISKTSDVDGILVRAKGSSLSPVQKTPFFSELPNANFDMNKFPRIGTFSITKPNGNSGNEVYLYASVQGKVSGREGNEKNNGILGILIDEKRVEDIPEGRINVTLDKVFYELEPLEDIIKDKGLTIVNDYEVNIRGYKAYAFVGLKSNALYNSRDVVAYYGTYPFAYFDQTYNLTGPAAAYDAGNEYSEREEAQLEENKKKIGLAITWEDGSGNKTTKVKFNDETVIGTTSGDKNVKFSIMISKDLDWTKLKAYIVNNNNYSDRKISTIINPENLVPSNSSDFDEFKSKYGDYKFYSIEGDIYIDNFEMVISYDGREILKSSKF